MHHDIPRERKTIDYRVGSVDCQGVASIPRGGTEPFPCVLVAHDWSGINSYTLATADEMARRGYVGFAADLYGEGRRGDPRGDNSALMEPLMEDRDLLLTRMRAGLEAAAGLPEVDKDRIAVLGYCFGGLCALDLARSAPEGLVGAISVHGLLTPPPGRALSPMTARVLILHGWEDPMAPPQDVRAAAAELTRAGAPWELHAYGHALHAFTFEGASFPERGLQHHPLAHRRSWAATMAFLAETLESTHPEPP